MHAWLNWGLSTDNIGCVHWSWLNCFCVIVWRIWNDKNELMFSNSSTLYIDFLIKFKHYVSLVVKETNKSPEFLKQKNTSIETM